MLIKISPNCRLDFNNIDFIELRPTANKKFYLAFHDYLHDFFYHSSEFSNPNVARSFADSIATKVHSEQKS